MPFPDNSAALIHLPDYLTAGSTFGLASRRPATDRGFLGIIKIGKGSIDRAIGKPPRIVMLIGVLMFPDEGAVPVIFRHAAADGQRDPLAVGTALIREQAAVRQQISPVRHANPADPFMGDLAIRIEQKAAVALRRTDQQVARGGIVPARHEPRLFW